MSGVRVTYFNLFGRAEFIRAMLDSKNVQYQNEEIEQAQWPEVKGSGRFPFNSMPEVEMNGVKINQSKAAARAVAINYGYYSTDPETMHAIDALLDFSQETLDAASGYAFDTDKTPEKDDNWVAVWKKKGDLLENRLKMHGKPFLAGTTSPTLCDFSVVCHYFSQVYNPNCAFGPLCQRVKDEVIAKQPLMKRYLEETCMNDPAFKAWAAARDANRPGRPF